MNMGPKEQILRAFVILKEPGKIPEKKGPFTSYELLNRFIDELETHRPTAELTICELTWDLDLWVESGREWQSMRRLGCETVS